MKALLVILVIAAASAEVTYSNEELHSIALDFVKGFLTGLGETKSIEDLEKCMTNIEAIIVKIKEAFEEIKKMTMEGIIKGITDLIAAFKEIADIIKPCTTGYTVLEKLIKAIYNTDYQKILAKFLKHVFEFITWVTTAVECFNTGDYNCVGKQLGMLMKALFLDETLEAKPALDFIMGFLIAIGDTPEEKNLEKCAKDINNLVSNIKKALEEFKKKKLQNIIAGLNILAKAVKSFLDGFKPCAQGLNNFQKVIQALTHPDFKKIAARILKNIGKIIADVQKIISDFQSKNYKGAGTELGNLIKLIFL